MLGGYWWPYHGTDVRAMFREVLTLAVNCGGLDDPVMWTDVETYQDWYDGVTIPNAVEVESLADESLKLGVTFGAYSSPPMWSLAGNPQLGSRCLSWGAAYVEAEPADLIDAPRFGGMTPVGWQWTSTPLDQSLMLR